MFGIPTFDLLSDRGKQEFIEYVVNLTRKEINSYTPSYNQNTQSIVSSSANPYYGSFYDTTDQSIVTANTNQVVTINSTWGSNGVSVVAGSKITFEYPGTYTLTYVTQVSNLSNAIQDVNFWLKFNGADYPHSSTEVNIQPRKSAGVPSSQLVTISIVGTATNPNDYVELWWWATSTDVSLQSDSAHVSPTSPESPSVIVSVTPVSNIQTGERGATGATGPTGATGATGATGPTGSAATIAVGTVTTGAAGSSAIITNSGSSAAATFDFTIPRGDTGALTGTAGGVLAGSYPNPTFAVDMATQAELDTHTSATTSVHGISNTANLVYTSDSRLSDARTPTAHAATHIPGGADVLDYSKIIGYGTALPTFSASLHPAGVLWAVNTVGEPYALYRSNGSSFLKVGGGGSITVSDTAPTGVAGNLWYASLTGKTYIYYDSFWVEVGNTGAVDITADTIIPAGMIMPTAGSVEPSGWLYCYGQNLSRSTYARLFTAVGTTYGVGDGSTTFGMPDLRGRTIAGRDNMGGTTASRLTVITGTTLGAAGGDERLQTHTHTGTTGTESANHYHTRIQNSLGETSGMYNRVNNDTMASGDSTVANGGGSNARAIASSTQSANHTHSFTSATHNQALGTSQNIQPTMVLNYLIKT